MLNICSWNVRGLNNLTKRCMVRNVISSLRNAVICLQESKVRSVSCSFLRSFAGPLLDKRQIIEANGASGGLITCWSSKCFECTEVLRRNSSITVHLLHRGSGQRVYVTNVYDPQSGEEKAAFCTELAQLKTYCSGNWVLCGDFNLTRTREERNGGRGGRSAVCNFNDLISDLELIDLPLQNQRITWSNLQRHPALAKLDRFLVSTEWDSTFPLSAVEALPRITSDHYPILLSTGGKGQRTEKIFRFEEAWLKCEDFVTSVPSRWSEVGDNRSGVLNFTAKLRHCRKRIKNWCASHFYSVREAKKSLSREILDPDRAEEREGLSSTLFDRRIALKCELTKVLEDEESIWKARAKLNWLKEGDGNTKFFHALANCRRRCNTIGTIADDGTRYVREEDKKTYFTRKFKELFSPRNNDNMSFGDWSELFRLRRLPPPRSRIDSVPLFSWTRSRLQSSSLAGTRRQGRTVSPSASSKSSGTPSRRTSAKFSSISAKVRPTRLPSTTPSFALSPSLKDLGKLATSAL